MASTVIRGAQIKDSTVQRHDLDTSTVGQAVVTKIVQGSGTTLSSTGADSGTGDVTINASSQWKGVWNSATAYVVNDQVIRYGSQYIALANNTNFDPSTLVGPVNFGNTAQGANSGSWTGIAAVKISVTAAGTLKSLSMFSGTAGVSNVLGLYSDSAGAPGALLATTATFTLSIGLNTALTTTNPSVSIGSYWVGSMSQTIITGYNDTGGNGYWNNSQSWGALPNPFPGGSSNGAVNFSLYATINLFTNTIWASMATGGQAGLSTDSGNIASGGSDGLILVPQSQIWSVRLRSFNAIGNPTFEVTQRNCGTVVSNPAHGSMIEDRWAAWNNGALNPSFQAIQAAVPINLPGTNFGITRGSSRIINQTQKITLAATDLVGYSQAIEGPQFRELMNDIHSVSILCRSSVASLKFGLSIRDIGGSTTKCLTKLCTLGAANTLTLITVPNLPIFPSGNFSIAPGSASYSLTVMLACGSTYMSPANDTWQNGNFVGAVGQDNFLGTSVNSSFDLFFIQHEPGAMCTMPIDCPFRQNLDDCLRYYEKSYPYGVALGSVNAQGMINFWAAAGQNPFIPIRFKKIMARIPTTIAGYDPVTGAGGGVRDYTAGGTRAISSVNNYGDTGFNGFAITAQNAGIWQAGFHYIADTGW